MKFLRAAAMAALAAAGCTKPAEIKSGAETQAAAADPWATAVSELRRTNDPPAVKRILTQLTSDLTGVAAATRPPAMPADRIEKLAAYFRLDPAEKSDLNSPTFTPTDSQYVADALYLRDAAAALDVRGLPPADRAAAAFAWVCRQVYLKDWSLRTGPNQVQFLPPMPPVAVLRRGFGNGLERAYIFLALCQQLGLDGVLIGGPGAGEKAGAGVADGKPIKGPFWAVGVRTDGGTVLFDPWRGEVVPAPGGKGAATLAQLQAAPELVRPWADGKMPAWDVTPQQVKDATVYATAPLSGLTPRMKLLEDQLGAGTVRLAVDAPPPPLWAPAKTVDPFSYPRTAAAVLPPSRPGERSLADYSLAAQLPADFDANLPKFASLELRERVRNDIVTAYLVATGAYALRESVASAPASDVLKATGGIAPRDLLLRGQFNDLLKAIIPAEGKFASVLDRARSDPQGVAAVGEWLAAADGAFARVTAAKVDGNLAALAEAETRADRLWSEPSRGRAVLVDTPVSAAGRAECAYLIAMAKHEQAERAQTRYLRNIAGTTAAPAAAAAAGAWTAATDAWQRYAPLLAEQDASFPGRAAHAKTLTARAKTLAADPTK